MFLILELYSVLLQISRNGGDEGACSILVGEACTMRVLGAIQVVAWSQLSHAAVGEMGKPSSGPESQRQDFKIHMCSLSALPWLNTQGKRR